MNKPAGSAARYLFGAIFLLGFTSCGGGGSGGGGAGGGATSSTAVSNSTEASSGSLGVFISNGNATVAAPSGASTSGSSSGNSGTTSSTNTAYLITLPSAQNPTPSYTQIQCNTSSFSISGVNLDTQHSVGVAFDINSYQLEFFQFSTGSNVSNCNPYTNLTATDQIDTSAGLTDVGGVVMDPSIQTAIVETGSGFQFVDYSNPQSPGPSTVYNTIPPYTASGGGIDLVENFAYDPYLVVGGVSYKMILSGSGEVSYSQGKSDGFLLEFADIQTGIIYRPDSNTAAIFPTSTSNGCSADAIGVDTSYQVAIIGCEYDGLSKPNVETSPSLVTVLVNLNALVLHASSGTYSLPSTAVSIVTLTQSAPPQNNIFVDSVNHIVMWGAGGDWGSSGSSFSVARLSDPFTSFGNGIVGGAATLATMPAFSSSNTDLCPLSGCTSSSSYPSSWDGYGYPHGSAMYVDSSGNSVALWMNQSASFLAMVKANEFLTGIPSNGVTYIGIP